MRTIFITIFQGVEAKNILRTPLLPALLAEKDIRVVLFTEHEEKVDFYKKEFLDPRLIYEVVARMPITGIDRFFSFLKFQLLRTETTNLRRKMAIEKGGNYFLYLAGHFFNWIIARPLFLKIVRWLDFLLVKNNTFAPYFEKYNPDVVLCAHLFDEPEVHLLREAKKRCIPSIGFINSWDKVTARCVLRLLPDALVVFNTIVKRELIRYDAVSEKNIHVCGIPQYDQYVYPKITKREMFFKKIGIDFSKKLIVYAPMGRAFSNSDWDMIDMLYDLRDKGELGDVDILVRFQPNDFIEEAELKRRPFLHYDYPGMRFSAKRGIDWDMGFEDLTHLTDTLYYMDLLICYASSMSIDAAFFGKPVINIGFEIREQRYLDKSPTQFYQMTHYKNALDTGGIRLVKTKKELVDWIKKYVEHPELDREERNRLVAEQCQFIDGKSGERIANVVIGMLHS